MRRLPFNQTFSLSGGILKSMHQHVVALTTHKTERSFLSKWSLLTVLARGLIARHLSRALRVARIKSLLVYITAVKSVFIPGSTNTCMSSSPENDQSV